MGILNKEIDGKGVWKIVKKVAMAILFMFLIIVLTGSGTAGWCVGLLILYLEFKLK